VIGTGSLVVAVGARGAGQRFGPPRTPAGLSAKAAALGLRTRQDVDREFAAAREGWGGGTDYHCPFCDRDFWSRSGARRHMRSRAHPVPRWDWYGPHRPAGPAGAPR
jgi:hypothetical protein